MFNSTILDVAIGVIMVFLLVSILCTAIREGIEAWLKTRAAYLEYGIRELLQDRSGNGLAATLYKHPMIYGLYSGEYIVPPNTDKPGKLAKGGDLPSYIPARNFALALMDIAARGPDSKTVHNDAGVPILDLQQVREGIAALGNGPVQRSLLTAVDAAQGDLIRAQKNIEAWFDSSMDRVAGWYRRSTQTIVFAIALVIALGCNINTVTIADFLYRNSVAREALVKKAEDTLRDSQALKAGAAEVRAELQGLSLPIGWSTQFKAAREAYPRLLDLASLAGLLGSMLLAIICAVPGCLLTAFAAMLGAPFWFDVLNKFMVVRSTVKPREKSPEEATEIGQRPPETAYAHTPLDACDIDLAAHPTADEDLPPARGGVAQ